MKTRTATGTVWVYLHSNSTLDLFMVQV